MTNGLHGHDTMTIVQLIKVSCSRFPNSELKGIKPGFHFRMPLYTYTPCPSLWILAYYKLAFMYLSLLSCVLVSLPLVVMGSS